jgi:glucokinase
MKPRAFLKGRQAHSVFRQRFAAGFRHLRSHHQGIFPGSRHASRWEKIRAAGFRHRQSVINNRVRATNLPWTVDAAVLSSELSIEHIILLNDLGAWGHSIEYLDPTDFAVLNPGCPEIGGTRALLAAGTGLGEAFLVWDGTRYQVGASEGGHSDFAPHTEQEIELLRFMRRRYPQVSFELILSAAASVPFTNFSIHP